MKEDFLHYVWEFQKFETSDLKTSEGADLVVLSPGMHNFSSGPDFFNSQVVIGEQKWAGNVEIHINSSDWYFHNHETDTSYDNVILHVVWNHDTEVFRKNNATVPVLELRWVVSKTAVSNYENLLKNPGMKWINCEMDFHLFDEFTLQNWLERLYFERLEQRSAFISELLKDSSNDWEEVLFWLVSKNFGLNVNGDAFLSMARSFSYSLVRKVGEDQKKLEALFLGQQGMLEKELQTSYFQNLREEYRWLKIKYGLSSEGVTPVKYFRLRPDNFPNIRLSQLAMLYHQRPGLFSDIINADSLKDLYRLFRVQVSDFWGTHFTFQKPHSFRKKELSNNFIDLIIINTIVPVKFCYARTLGKDINEELLNLMVSVRQENNSIISRFNELRKNTSENALQSQALLQLKKEYCEKHSCLKCSLGIKLLQREAQI